MISVRCSWDVPPCRTQVSHCKGRQSWTSNQFGKEWERDIKFIYLLFLLAENRDYQGVEKMSWPELSKALDEMSPLQERDLANMLERLTPLVGGVACMSGLQVEVKKVDGPTAEYQIHLSPEDGKPEFVHKVMYLGSLLFVFQDLLTGMRKGSAQSFFVAHEL